MKAMLERVSAQSRQSCQEDGYDPSFLDRLADDYLDVWMRQGYVGLTCKEALEAPDYLWATFYMRLKDRKGLEGCPPSPVAGAHDSSWMRDYDFCFFNVRATSTDPSTTGDFFQALKLLPVLRTRGLHLAPMMDCNFGNVYCIDSLHRVNPVLLSPLLEGAGITGNRQLRFFVDTAHMAGFVVGFDLEPHTSQFSRVVLDHPEYFRWIRLDAARKSTVPADMSTLMKPETQREIHGRVRAIVSRVKDRHGLETMDDARADYDRVKKAHGEAIDELIEAGLWTLPSHTWGGVGLPEFSRYDKKGNYPVFDYRNAEGEDHSGHAFGMLTPYRFYDNLPPNRLPSWDSPPKAVDDTIDFFASIFPRLQEEYGFDFVRVDYVDHVFDSVMEPPNLPGKATESSAGDIVDTGDSLGESGGNAGHVDCDESATLPGAIGTSPGKADCSKVSLPVSDRVIPPVLERVISAARSRRPETGAMAERMGTDVVDYGSVGFDLLLGCDILGPVHREAVSGTLAFNAELAGAASSVGRIASVTWAVDTHDSGNPLFWTRPVSEVVGSGGMLLRQFVARFATAGSVRRPKYECIGNQDMSHGLFKANNENASLDWVGDRNHCRLYHAIEDVYARFSKLLGEGWIPWWEPMEDYCVWSVDTHQGPDGWRGRLICVAGLEKFVENLSKSPEDCEPVDMVESIEIDVSRQWDRPAREVFEVLLDGSGYERPVPLRQGHLLVTGKLPPRSYRLFLVRG